MGKRILYLLLILIVPIIIFSGCASVYSSEDKYSSEVKYVEIRDDSNIWYTHANITRYEFDVHTGMVYLYTKDGEVIITHISNVKIYCKQ